MTDKILTNERLVILAAAGALAIFLIFTELAPNVGRPAAPSSFAVGKSVPVRITLLTADAFDLACAGDTPVGEARCAFVKDGQPSPVASAGVGVLAPYMTVDNVLLLIPDLFAEPALAKRLADEMPEGKSRESLTRFNASCQLQIDQKVEDFFVRWTPTSAWSPRKEAWSGRVSDCKLN